MDRFREICRCYCLIGWDVYVYEFCRCDWNFDVRVWVCGCFVINIFWCVKDVFWKEIFLEC